MALQTYTMQEWNGLNLDDNPFDMGLTYAQYAYNWDFPGNGGLTQRSGVDQLSSTGMTGIPRWLFNREGLNKLLAVAPGEVAVYDASTGAKTVPGGAPTWAATAVTAPALFGTATGNRYVFIATTNAGAGVQLRRYEDTLAGVYTVGNSTVASKPQFVAVWPGQNRVVHVGFYAAADAPGGANGTPSTMFFSDEGAPETFQPTNFVNLDPGDSERVTGVVGFQNQLFLFKSSKVYVFFGVSPDDDGLPLPQYRTITLPDPIVTTADPTRWDPITVGPDGVYFATGSGLWKTTGTTPVRVPTKINRVFSGKINSVISNYKLNVFGQLHIGWNGDRLWMLYGDPVSNSVGITDWGTALSWNTQRNAWMGYTFPANPTNVPVSMVPSGVGINWPPMFFFGQPALAGPYHLYRESPSAYADLGFLQPIVPVYETGFSSLGTPSEKRMRFVDVWGAGDIGFSVITIGDRTGSATTVNTPIITPGSFNRRVRSSIPAIGREWQLKFSAAGGTTTGILPRFDSVDLLYAQGTPV